MAQTYNNTIDFASGFNVLQTGPLDSRLVVDSVENLTDGSIKAPYEGMVVNIKGTPALYILTKPGIENSKNFDNWKLVVGETSPYNIPIMTMEMYNDAINDKSTIFDETKDYILMDDGTTTLGETRNEQIILEDGSVHNGYNIKTPVGTYLDVMLKSIRRLQQEVNKLKNSFDYGICSMTEGNTGSGVIQDKLKDVIEQEPIWAIDTDYLSELDLSLVLTSADCALEPKDNWMMSDDNTTIKVSDECGYEFAEESAYIGETKEIYCVRYTPNDNDWDIKFTFNDTDEDEDKENKWSYELSMKDYLGETNYSNLMLVVDRHEKEEKVKDEDGNVVKDENGDDKVQYKSKSYIYISVSDEKTNNVGRTGYIDIVNNELKELETRFEHRFNITGVYFKNVDIYKAGFYVKDSTYTNEETIPEKEITDDFKYEVSHLTIRSVKTKATLTKYASRFLNNELIFCEENSRLYIKTQNNIKSIAGGGENDEEEGMTQQEMIAWLEGQGLITKKTGSETDYDLNLNFEEITFTHTESGKTFIYSTDAYGNLVSRENDTSIPVDQGPSKNTNNQWEYGLRGCVAKYNYELNKNNLSVDVNNTAACNSSVIAVGDRVRFGSWYLSVKNQQVFNCSHDFIELVNSGTDDYPLDNVILGFVRLNTQTNKYFIDTFNLSGTIKAGSTYLIRMKEHLNISSPLAHIKVDEFDIELWKEHELYDTSDCEALILFHKNALETFVNIDNITTIVLKEITGDVVKVASYLIDVVTFGNFHNECKSNNVKSWTDASYTKKENNIVKDMYSLDPAKQAYRAFGGKVGDSSNYRLEKVAAEYIPLKNDNINFVNSDGVIPIDRYVPKSSKSEKNVITDKTQPDLDRPNFVMCGFGKDGLTTRTFNWVSIGVYDEYIWVRPKGTTEWLKGIPSYTESTEKDQDGNPIGVSALTINGSGGLTITRPAIGLNVSKYVYGRITDTFPATDYVYTSHKLILNFSGMSMDENGVASFEYIVGRALTNGRPDMNHVSNVQEFTFRDTTWTPFIVHHTDQQGFSWVEYQVWNTAAKAIEKKIDEFMLTNPKHYPVLIETGDMTQNGTRVNEWLDFYNAGYNLFKKYEHMAVVGNNDLANSDDHNVLGTGDDVGKSNPFYFNVFHCYEIDNLNDSTNGVTWTEGNEVKTDNKWLNPVVIKTSKGGEFIPSLYYFKLHNNYYLMINSEITTSACDKLYGVPGNNIYTTHQTGGGTSPITWSIKKWCEEVFKVYNNDTTEGKKIVAACHEMPFTVITQEQLREDNENCRGGKNASKLNTISNDNSYLSDTNCYWFGRMLNENGCKLCIGGHKHTYAITYPIIETPWNDKDTNGLDKNKGMDIIIQRNKIENTGLFSEFKATIKFKFMNDAKTSVGYWGAGEYVNNENFSLGTKTPTTYLMMQATGYKQTSNKELPSRFQFFSKVVPISIVTDKSTADPSQQYPMYAIVNPDGDNFNIDVYRVSNAQKESYTKPTNKFDTYDKNHTMVYTTTTKITSLSYLDYPMGNVDSELLLLNKPTDSDFYNNYWYVGENYPNSIHSNDIQRCWGSRSSGNTTNELTIYSVTNPGTTPTYTETTMTFERIDHTMVI